MVTGIIKAIHATTTRDAVTKNAIKVHIRRAQRVKNPFVREFLSIVAYDDGRKIKKAYELKFIKQGYAMG